jgi:hypothetical protein
MTDGYNPMRWDCEKKGCYNKLQRPKIEIFYDCFPGKINFGDVDGIVEIRGRGLVLEWKGAPIKFSDGQHIMWTRLTGGYFLSLFAIAGNAETMKVTHRASCIDGKWRNWEEFNLEKTKVWVKQWADWAAKQKMFQPDLCPKEEQ